MSMFADVTVSNEIELPHFPEEIDREGQVWQSKRGLDVYGGPYRITADGRLEEKKVSHRDKTNEEKLKEAQRWGFDSWDEYTQAYRDYSSDDEESGLYPEAVDYDPEGDSDNRPPIARPKERTIEEEWWADISHHGTFEFHEILRSEPISYEQFTDEDGELIHEQPDEYALDVFLEYEARFTKGDLDEIVFMGDRHSSEDNPVQEALDEIESWREWKEE